MTNEHPRNPEQGSAMVVVVTILVALLAGGGFALYLQLQSTRATGLLKAERSALYCAEAGLAKGRELVGNNADAWPSISDADANNDPAWYPITGDIDADNVDDYTVTVLENGDTGDGAIFIISRCTKYAETPRELIELVSMSSIGHGYRNMSGQGAQNTGNVN